MISVSVFGILPKGIMSKLKPYWPVLVPGVPFVALFVLATQFVGRHSSQLVAGMYVGALMVLFVAIVILYAFIATQQARLEAERRQFEEMKVFLEQFRPNDDGAPTAFGSWSLADKFFVLDRLANYLERGGNIDGEQQQGMWFVVDRLAVTSLGLGRLYRDRILHVVSELDRRGYQPPAYVSEKLAWLA